MVHVTEHGHDWRAQLCFLLRTTRGQLAQRRRLCFRLWARHLGVLGLELEFFRDQRRRIVVERLVNRRKDAHRHQTLDQVARRYL